jgi:hypothetical protein
MEKGPRGTKPAQTGNRPVTQEAIHPNRYPLLSPPHRQVGPSYHHPPLARNSAGDQVPAVTPSPLQFRFISCLNRRLTEAI